MPRENRTRANVRPDTQIGGRRVRSRGGVAPERAGRTQAAQTADALVTAAGAAGDFAQRKAEEQAKERAKEQRLEAYQDYHADAAQGVTIEQAKAREAFGSDDYSDTYMRLSYGQHAREDSEELSRQVQEWSNDPDIGVDEINRRIDSEVSGIVSGLDDPDAVNVYANRLSSEAERLKQQATQTAIERQQNAGLQQLTAQIDDIADNDMLGSPESIQILEQTATNLNLSQSQAHKLIFNAASRKAIDDRDPTALDFLTREDENGVALADDPEIRDQYERTRSKVEAAKDREVTAGELEQTYQRNLKIKNGEYTFADAAREARDDPTGHTADQLVGYVMQSHDNAQSAREATAAQTQRLRESNNAEGIRRMTGGDQKDTLSDRFALIEQQTEDSPEGRQRAMMAYGQYLGDQLNFAGGGISENVLGPYLNSSATATTNDGSVSPAFQSKYEVYKQLESNPRTRGVANQVMTPEARRMYQRVRQLEQSGDFVSDGNGGRDITPAVVKAQDQLANPVDLDQIRTSQAYRQLQSTVDGITDLSSWFGLVGGGEVKNKAEVLSDMKRGAAIEMRYNHGDYQAALDSYKERYLATHSLVRGTFVEGKRGPNFDKGVDAVINRDLSEIQAGTGEETTPEDISAMPHRDGSVVLFAGSSPVLVPNGNGGLKPKTVSMQEADEAFREKERPKGTTRERVGTPDAEAEVAPEPPTGSPADTFRQSAESASDARERFKQSASSALHSLFESLQSREDKIQGPGGLNY